MNNNDIFLRKNESKLNNKYKQLSFLSTPKLEFGGSLLLNRRKTARILATKKPIHLVLKGDVKQSGSLRKKERQIEFEIQKWALKFDIKLYRFSINSDHIHLNIKIGSKESYRKFIKAVTGRIAQITKIKFIFRPYTKIMSWGREFRSFINYTIQNEEEAMGLRAFTQRKKRRVGVSGNRAVLVENSIGYKEDWCREAR